jgi:hypothetical protein
VNLAFDSEVLFFLLRYSKTETVKGCVALCSMNSLGLATLKSLSCNRAQSQLQTETIDQVPFCYSQSCGWIHGTLDLNCNWNNINTDTLMSRLFVY